MLVSLLITLLGFLLVSRRKKNEAAAKADGQAALRKPKLLERLGMPVCVFGVWLAVGSALTLLFGTPAAEGLSVSIIPPRAGFSVLGYQPSETMVVGWAVMAALIIVTILLRIFFIPRLSDKPGWFQNAVETIVESVEAYASARTRDLGRPMYGYIFAIGAALIGNMIAELMGFRSPSSDLMFTLALSLFTFLMANWYGIRQRSLKGRIRSLLSPTPLLLPIRLVTDLANPFSMACRLFGNAISGMIVMNLIYSVLGNFGAGVPSVVGLYFNVFFALIQTLIFITLTLSSINETTAEPET